MYQFDAIDPATQITSNSIRITRDMKFLYYYTTPFEVNTVQD